MKPLLRSGLILALLVGTAASGRAQLVTPRSSGAQILIPAAGAVNGNNGTFFRSDVTLLNYRAATQRVRFQWLPQGSSGAAIAPVELEMAAGTGLNSEDFVTTILHQTGLGAVLVSAITSTGNLDTNGRLYVTARIWTPQPGSTGTVSQTFPTLLTSEITSTFLTVVGQKRDDRYRSNAGIVNLDPTREQSYRITTNGGAADVNVTIPPFSMQQVPLSGPATTALQILIENVTPSVQLPFAAYGSSVDNITGDSWSSAAFPPPAG